MSVCLICLLRMSHCQCSQQANPAWWHPSHSNLTTELEDSRKFSLAALTALLAILAISGSKALQPVVLTLLMYTITLRLALNTCFLQDYPTISRLLHVIPLLGISCMACIELIFGMQSPGLATVCIFLGILPLVTMVIHHGTQCAEMSTAVLPVRMYHVLAPAVSDPADHTPASNSVEGTSETFSSNPC